MRILSTIFLLLIFSSQTNAQTLEDEAVAWLQEFIQVDTINPPGNEFRAVDFYAKIFDAEGIEWESAESAPGRGNIWARIEGGDEPALMLLQHTDVVPADLEYWTTDPLSGELRDGYILGRGARDMKGTGISHLAAFLSLHRSGRPLNRDVIFVASADEEAGGAFGVGWLTENHPEIFDGVGLLLNEGGSGARARGSDQVVFGVEVTQKVPVWLRLTAVDVPGHGSSPRTTSSVTRIVDALGIMRVNPFPARIIAPVDVYFKGLSMGRNDEWAAPFGNMSLAIQDPEFLTRLQEDSPGLHSLTRDTCSMTRLSASSKINVVAPEAWAELDCRILPDKPAEQFIAELTELIAPAGVEVSVIMAFTPAVSSTTSRLFTAIERVTKELYPNSRVLPSVSTGFTDSHFTRDKGIVSYGFDPIISIEGDPSGVHGNDERINVDAFRQGIRDMQAIVRDVVYN
jgi:acetylornithine deacetylase/succinyl-diaminopimelate desuccinylase-like protein